MHPPCDAIPTPKGILRPGGHVSNLHDLLAGGTRSGIGTVALIAIPIGHGQQPTPVVVGNAHVLHAHGATAGQLLFQPQIHQAGDTLTLPADGLHAVAELLGPAFMGHHRFAYPGEPPADYFIDVAAARLLPGTAIDPWPAHWPADVPKRTRILRTARLHPADISLGGTYPVWKAGHATGWTRGLVMSVRGEVVNPGEAPRQNVIIIRSATQQPFCAEGDSGAPLYNRAGALVGILWGRDPRDPRTAYACPIEPCLDALRLVIAQPHHLTSWRTTA